MRRMLINTPSATSAKGGVNSEGSFWACPFLALLSFYLYLAVFGKAKVRVGKLCSSWCPDVVSGFSGFEVRIPIGVFCWQWNIPEIKMALSN